MILVPYTSIITIDPTTPGNKIALVHPGGSQTGSLFFRGIDLVEARLGTVPFRLKRHPSKATGGTTNLASSFLDNALASFAEVRFGDVAWPVDTPTLDQPAFADPRGSGGGIVVPTNNASAGALTIGPNHSLIIETIDPDTRGEYNVRLLWGEQRPGVTILSSVLPAYPTFTTGTYFNVPMGWSRVTFYVTYTAVVGSTNARPCWRGSCSDGTNDYPLLLADDVPDLSAAPIARRTIYHHEDRWSSAVAATTTVRFPVTYRIPAGALMIRLDISEFGDLTNRGSVVVAVTGE